MELKYKPPKTVEHGFHDIGVQAAIDLMGRNSLVHNRAENEWRVIQDLFTNQFSVQNPSGTKKINSKVLMQAAWKLVNKMKPLDFEVHGTGADEWTEKMAVDGISTVLEEGNYAQCLRDKGGAFWKMAMFGDAFVQIGTFEDKDYPIQFRVCSLSDVYVDNSCNDVRDAAGGQSATEMVLIYRYNWRNFKGYFPDFADKVAIGNIPRPLRWRKQLEKSWLQTLDTDGETIEVGYYFNCAEKKMTVFAGSACTVLDTKEGEDYPYQIEEKGYIPVLHFKCFPSHEGFYNYGLGHMLYDLAVVMARMDNMAINHAEDNVYPINVVGVPSGESTKFFQKVLQANQQRAVGGKGYVIQEYDAQGKQSITMEPFQSQPITNEWERVFTRLEQQITRLGIQLEAVDRGTNVTATQVLSEEENADSVVKQIMEMNASEFKFAVEVVIDTIKKTISHDDPTPLNSTTLLQKGDVQAKVDNLTLGDISELLSQYKFFVKVNSRSGAIPSNIMRQTQVQRALSMAMPGTPLYARLASNFLRLNDLEASPDDFSGSSPQGQPAEDMPQEEGLMPSETDMVQRQKATAMRKNPVAAL